MLPVDAWGGGCGGGGGRDDGGGEELELADELEGGDLEVGAYGSNGLDPLDGVGLPGLGRVNGVGADGSPGAEGFKPGKAYGHGGEAGRDGGPAGVGVEAVLAGDALPALDEDGFEGAFIFFAGVAEDLVGGFKGLLDEDPVLLAELVALEFLGGGVEAAVDGGHAGGLGEFVGDEEVAAIEGGIEAADVVDAASEGGHGGFDAGG